MSEFIQSLCESRLFPSKQAFARYTAREAADLLHLYVSALAILRMSDETERWAMQYARHTTRNGTVKKWRGDATDLELLIVAVMDGDVEMRLPASSDDLKAKITLDENLLVQWLKNVATPTLDRNLMRRLFSKIDIGLRITDSSLKSIRRLAQDWTVLDEQEARLLMTRLLQLLRHEASRGEVLAPLNKLAHHRQLEMKDVQDVGKEADPEETEEKPKKSFLASLTKLDVDEDGGYNSPQTFAEEATSGATTAGDIAPVVNAFMPVQRRAVPDRQPTKNLKKKPK